MVELRQTARTRADLTTTWRILTDHAAMAHWSSQVLRSRLERPGVDRRNGVGAVRHVVALAGPVDEEVTAYEEPTRLGYRMAGGPPIVRNYRGLVELVPEDARTRIVWTIRFDPRPSWLGALIAQMTRLSTNHLARDLARAADQKVASTPGR